MNLLICTKCAEKYSMMERYDASDIRSIANKGEPGCELCGEPDVLSEISVSDDLWRRMKLNMPYGVVGGRVVIGTRIKIQKRLALTD